ncbi:MAG: phage tail tube protein [Kofleriaceae bacterium]
MPPTTFAPANLQWVGVAREAVYGTPETAPTLFIPSDSPLWKPNINPMVDGNLRGSMGGEYEQIGGIRFDTVTFKTKAYLDSVFFALRALLGYPDQVTGSSDPYTHTTALQNTGNNGQPAGTTVFWTDGAGKTRRMPGAQLTSVKLSIKPDELVEIEVNFVGLPAASINMPTNTPTTAKPWPGWNSTITIGGVDLTKYSELSLEYKRASEVIPTITGSQTPFAIFGGPVTVSGSLVGVYQGDTDNDLAALLANTQPVLVYKLAPQGDATHYLQVTHSKVAYDAAEPQGTNKWMEIKSTVKALSNPTDAIGGLFSPAKAVLLTPVSTAI